MSSKKHVEKNAPVDSDFSLEAVPESARKGFRSLFFVMLGFTFFSASMSVGAKLGNGLNLSGFIWACLIGGLILCIYCGFLAYIGADTGMTMDLLCRRVFGKKGSISFVFRSRIYTDRLVWSRRRHVFDPYCPVDRNQ